MNKVDFIVLDGDNDDEVFTWLEFSDSTVSHACGPFETLEQAKAAGEKNYGKWLAEIGRGMKKRKWEELAY